jgi:hypothetical protein
VASNLLTVTAVVALVAALSFVALWGGRRSDPEPLLVADRVRPTDEVLRRFVRSLAIAVSAGTIAGVLVGGLGSRLAMRVMAATSGDDAQGAITEADEVVGRITVDGTLGLVVFVGLGLGSVAALLYLLVRRWLPWPAWLSGLLYGVLLLAVFGRDDPVDPENPDFLILSPTWLAVVMFTLLLPLYGLVLGSLVARLDAAYPELSAQPKVLVAYAPLLLFAPLFPVVVPVAVIALVAVAAQRIRPLARAWRSQAVDRVGRAALALIGVIGLGFFGAGLAEILG